MPEVIADADARSTRLQPVAADTAMILCGGLKPPPLAEAVGIPLLKLPHNPDQSLFEVWLAAFAALGIPPEKCCLLIDPDHAHCVPENGDAGIRPVIDAASYRGPAGVLRDAIDAVRPGRPILIIESSRLLESPETLADLVRTHAERDDSVTVATNPDGSFAGVFVADPAAIELIPKIGFMDIKEQWLPAASKNGFRIRSHPLKQWCPAIRTRATYLDALRRLGRFESGEGSRVVGANKTSPFGVAYGSSMICRSAVVSPDSVAAQSVVCDRACVEAGAVVVRSIIGPGARVPENAVIVDTVIPAADVEIRGPRGRAGKKA